MKYQRKISGVLRRIFKPDLRTAFSRHVYALLGLGICMGLCLLIGIKLQTDNGSIGGVNHTGFFTLAVLMLIIVIPGQFLRMSRAYSRMMDGYSQLDDSDTIHYHGTPISA